MQPYPTDGYFLTFTLSGEHMHSLVIKENKIEQNNPNLEKTKYHNILGKNYCGQLTMSFVVVYQK